jgi:hypothetical protein
MPLHPKPVVILDGTGRRFASQVGRDLGVLACIASVACAGDKDPSIPNEGVARLTHARFRPALVKSTVLATDTMFSMLVEIRVVNDSQLVAIDFRPPYFRLIDRRTGALIATLGRRGGGPGEYSTNPRIAPRADGRSIWVYDMQRSTLTLAHLDPPMTPADSTVHFAHIGGNAGPIGIDDTTVVLLGAKDSAAFGVVDFRTGARRLIGERMKFGSDSLPMRPEWRASLTGDVRGCRDPKTNRFVRFHRKAGRLEYLSAQGDLLVAAETPYVFEPGVALDGKTYWAVDGPQRIAYNACVAMPNLVVALFSGRRDASYRPVSQYAPSEAHVFEFVHVFDWSGKLVKVLQLDQPTWWMMDIDPKTLEMFGLTDEPVPAVLRYDLRDVLPTPPSRP